MDTTRLQTFLQYSMWAGIMVCVASFLITVFTLVTSALADEPLKRRVLWLPGVMVLALMITSALKIVKDLLLG